MTDSDPLSAMMPNKSEVDASCIDNLPMCKMILDFQCAAYERTAAVCRENVALVDMPDGDDGKEVPSGPFGIPIKLPQTMQMHANHALNGEEMRRSILVSLLRDKQFLRLMIHEAMEIHKSKSLGHSIEEAVPNSFRGSETRDF